MTFSDVWDMVAVIFAAFPMDIGPGCQHSVDDPEPSVLLVFVAEAKSPVNLCKPNPCMNQGVCILGSGSYRCECHGWEGPHCESSKDQQMPATADVIRSAQHPWTDPASPLRP